MKKVEALEALGFIGQTQLGMFTTAQAVRSGVSRLHVQRLEADGTIVRLRNGVYALPSSFPGVLQDVYAAWLFITKTRNLAAAAECVIVSGQTAAVLHDIGDFVPPYYEFTVAKKRKTRQYDIRYRVATVPEENLTYIRNMPVLSISATLKQLRDDSTDGGHLADAVQDALRKEATPIEREKIRSEAITLDGLQFN